MAQGRERPQHERETLVYASPEQAQEFRDRFTEQTGRDQQGVVRRDREVIAQQLADEMATAGESPRLYSMPWNHNEAEHAEAQTLVNIAFAKDLPAALRQARKSRYYPRNLDLFHDVLTNEMYDLLRSYRLDRQPLGGWLLAIFGVFLIAVLGILALVLFG